jgi:hypothetical protein
MGLTELVAGLDSYLKTAEKELEALRSLLQSGRISGSTFELVEKKVARKRTLVFELKEALTAEEDYWRNSITDATRILERLLVELEHRHILGEIGDDELEYKSGIINLGLTSLTGKASPPNVVVQEPAQPIQTTLELQTLLEPVPKPETAVVEEPAVKEEPQLVVEEPAILEEEPRTTEEEPLPEEPTVEEPVATPAAVEEEPEVKPVQPKKTSNGGQAVAKRRKSSTKEPPDAVASDGPSVHCMNPWKPDCRSTDIGLSIYYKGRSVPICRKCWEEISEKNIEWEN